MPAIAPSGGATPSSTRSTRARSRTPTATGSATSPGSSRALDHLEWLGVDALWLSPFYPSPGADFGYDVADYTAVDPAYGTLDDFDALVAACHDRGIEVLLDLVASHTSIEHPWFREHPDRYVWADGERPPNNWVARLRRAGLEPRRAESGRWYLHSFYPEQPDLDWRNPEVAPGDRGGDRRFWRERGVDGFRLDAIERAMKDRELRDDPPASGAAGAAAARRARRALDPVHSRNDPEIALGARGAARGRGRALLVGEVYLPTAGLGPLSRAPRPRVRVRVPALALGRRSACAR